LNQTETILNLKSLQTSYLELVSKQKNEEAEVLYWSELYPLVQAAVNQRLPVPAGSFDLLILLVGFSPTPLILSINALKPKEVVFLVSPESRGQLDLIFEKTGLKPSQAKWIEVDSSKVEQVFQTIKDVVLNKDPKRVAIDITGGKKSMVGGAAQAAALLGCAAFYVDYDEYHPQFRKPNPGSEYLSFLKNPYEIFGDLEDRRARDLYETGNYAAAVEIAARLARKLPDSREQEFKRSVYAMFQKWEEYQFEKALRSATEALEISEQFNLLINTIPDLKRKIKTLQAIIANDPLYIILNHYYMAMVYSNRGKYDFAILLLYRAIELIFSRRLLDVYQIEASWPQYQNYPGLLEKYNAALPEIYGSEAREWNELPGKLGLMAAATLLHIWQDPVMDGLNLKNLREQADQRNQGILAHGLKPNTLKQFDSMHKFFKPVFIKYLDLQNKAPSVADDVQATLPASDLNPALPKDVPELSQINQLFGRIEF